MTDHVLIILIGGIFATLQLVGIVLLGLQLREARRDTQRLSQTMASMALGLDALSRRLG